MLNCDDIDVTKAISGRRVIGMPMARELRGEGDETQLFIVKYDKRRQCVGICF